MPNTLTHFLLFSPLQKASCKTEHNELGTILGYKLNLLPISRSRLFASQPHCTWQ